MGSYSHTLVSGHELGTQRRPETGSLRIASDALAVHTGRRDLRSAPAATAAPVAARLTTARATWLSWYVAVIATLDALALLLATTLGQLVRFDALGEPLGGIGYGAIVALALPAWLLILTASRTYEGRILGLGSDEYRRVANAAARFTVLVATLNFLLTWQVSRGFVAVALPACALFTLVFRFAARKVLHRVRRDGRACHRVLVVGDGSGRQSLTEHLGAAAHSGLRVVGSCRTVDTGSHHTRDIVDHVRERALQVGADTVAIAHSAAMTPAAMRRLAWSLEGSGLDLIVAPALTDVAGPRINIRPVSGLPLLQIAEPRFSGIARVIKKTIDVTVAGLLVLLLAPVLATVAVLVKTTSPGPVLFKQVRIGRNGTPFRMYKFRSMFTDAEARLEELHAQNDHGNGAVLFKMRNDPRITPVGHYLRRFSLDELPQFFNVLLGTMSLVGPRPPLPREVARYDRDVHRRLLVPPGITGLWQVSGRSDLSWDESVRLDLYYVENWSVAVDAEILWKTLSAVLRGSGAR